MFSRHDMSIERIEHLLFWPHPKKQGIMSVD